MIYWIQEATQAGTQEAASSWPSVLLTNGVVGALVGLAGVLIAQVLTQRRHSQMLEQTAELEAQRAHEAALQKYFEQVGKMLADPERPLRRSTLGDNLSTVARAQTLAVLEGLDPDRKRILLQFLYESNLIQVDDPIISLRGANLSGADLSGANLSRANLSRANLTGADLSRADLSRANLTGTDLTAASLREALLNRAILMAAILREADLMETILVEAILSGAILREANLSGAILRRAILVGAGLSGADLEEAKLMGASLSGAILREAKSLTYEQINQATGDEHTQLPDHLHRPAHWSRSKGAEGARSPQNRP
jgi:uncharacterized protein YjbI with pentapeptide repeats